MVVVVVVEDLSRERSESRREEREMLEGVAELLRSDMVQV